MLSLHKENLKGLSWYFHNLSMPSTHTKKMVVSLIATISSRQNDSLLQNDSPDYVQGHMCGNESKLLRGYQVSEPRYSWCISVLLLEGEIIIYSLKSMHVISSVDDENKTVD